MQKLLLLLLLMIPFVYHAQTSIAPLECIAPFYHGVASGDPLTDRVIIWTRVTPVDFSSSPIVSYKMALDPGFTTIVAQGTYTTNSAQDFTVKVDVDGLDPNTFYFYEFEYEGSFSAVGRTKTLPVGDVDNIRLAVVSCANLEAGYFNVYQAINERNDVDAVLMLGDYIYEYETGGYSPNINVDRTWEPAEEIIDLADYRLRYSTYHMDYALRNLHQNFPWICIWDDHETANDSFKDGAENHSVEEGEWDVRKENGKKAFFEWLPIRPKVEGNTQIFRSFEFGNLAEVIMLDTRLEGRDEQAALGSAALNDTSRTILGTEQFTWLKDELSNSSQTWKVLGNQVMMGKINVLGSPLNTDGWDGYPAERQRLYNHIQENSITNFVVATGDIHTSWAMELKNGSTPIGVEFVTPSVTSPGVPINIGGFLTFENPHLKYVELTKKGFVILDITAEKIQSDWYYINTIDQMNPTNSCQKSLVCNQGTGTLVASNLPSTGHGPFITPLMSECSRFTSIEDLQLSAIIGLYPNPSTNVITLQLIGENLPIDFWTFVSSEGKEIQLVPTVLQSPSGSSLFVFDVEKLPAGTYNIYSSGKIRNSSISFVKY
ncbi:MAG: alkaline phosphatase D family protein [Flavobacteriia bacterium]|jgi:alkaline phosphatase D